MHLRFQFATSISAVLLSMALALVALGFTASVLLSRASVPGLEGRTVLRLQLVHEGLPRQWMDRSVLADLQAALGQPVLSGANRVVADVAIDGREPRQLPLELIEPGYFEALGLATRPGLAGFAARGAAAPEVVVSRGLLERDPGFSAVRPGDSIRINEADYRVVAILEGGFQGTSHAPVELWMPMSQFRMGDVAVGAALRNVSALAAFAASEGAEQTLAALDAGLQRTRALDEGWRLQASPLALQDAPGLDEAVQGRMLILSLLLFLFAWSFSSVMDVLRSLRERPQLQLRRQLGAQFNHLLREQGRRALRRALALAVLALLFAWGLMRWAIAEQPGLAALGLDLSTVLRLSGPWIALLWLALFASAWAIPLLIALPGMDRFAPNAFARSVSGRRALGAGLILQSSVAAVFMVIAFASGSRYAAELRFGYGLGVSGFSLVHTDYRAGPSVRFSSRSDQQQSLQSALDLLSRQGAFRAEAFTRLPGAIEGADAVVELRRADAADRPRAAVQSFATDGAFQLAGMQLLAGSGFVAGDADGVVLGRRAARELFGDESSALGQWIELREPPREHSEALQVRGVVNDLHLYGRAQGATAVVFRPAVAARHARWTFVVEPGAAPALAELIQRFEVAGLPLKPVRLLEASANPAHIAGPSAWGAWLGVLMSIALALLSAFSLGAVGLLAVQMRLRELAIRLSLGETATRLVRRVLARCLAEASAGLALGTLVGVPLADHALGASAAAGEHVGALLALALLAIAALGAALLPAALRVLRLQPSSLLREA